MSERSMDNAFEVLGMLPRRKKTVSDRPRGWPGDESEYQIRVQGCEDGACGCICARVEMKGFRSRGGETGGRDVYRIKLGPS
jgi:hypothetical protein